MRHDVRLCPVGTSNDPETDRAMRRAAFHGLDRLISTLPACEQLPAGEISALLRVIRDYGRDANEAPADC